MQKSQTKNFSVSLIPHTSEVTTLLSKRVGEVVNLENDVIGKYVKKLMGKSEKKGITLEFLGRKRLLAECLRCQDAFLLFR